MQADYVKIFPHRAPELFVQTMKIRRQLQILLAIAIAALLGLGGTALIRFQSNDTLRKQLTDRAIPGFVGASTLGANVKALEISVMTFIYEQDAALIESERAQIDADKSALLKALFAQRTYADTQVQQGLLAQADENVKNYFASIDQIVTLRLAGNAPLAVAILNGLTIPYQHELEQILITLRVDMQRNQDSAIEDVGSALLLTQYMLAAVTGIALLSLVLLGRRIGRQITGRVNQAVDAAHSVAEGHLDAPVNDTQVSGGDEIGMVLVALETMRQSLAEQFARLQTQKNELAAQSLELAAAKARAEGFERLKSTFLRNMSHEFRTPLNGIIGVFQLLGMAEIAPEQAELLRAGEDSAQRLAELIGDMLFYADLSTRNRKDDAVLFDTLEVLESVRRQFASRAAVKGLDLVVKVGPEVPEGALGHPGYLRRALCALADNGIKFSSAGSVTLEVDIVKSAKPNAVGQSIEFRVHDTGPGIPPEQLEQLFAAFVQKDGSETRQQGGVGIGLALTKALADAMNGEIYAENRAEGGATFTLRLPLKFAEAG
jgi:signal transduction histidine kinase